MRVMITGPHGWQSAMYLDDPSELALPYSRFLPTGEVFLRLTCGDCWYWVEAGFQFRNMRWKTI